MFFIFYFCPLICCNFKQNKIYIEQLGITKIKEYFLGFWAGTSRKPPIILYGNNRSYTTIAIRFRSTNLTVFCKKKKFQKLSICTSLIYLFFLGGGGIILFIQHYNYFMFCPKKSIWALLLLNEMGLYVSMVGKIIYIFQHWNNKMRRLKDSVS